MYLRNARRNDKEGPDLVENEESSPFRYSLLRNVCFEGNVTNREETNPKFMANTHWHIQISNNSHKI